MTREVTDCMIRVGSAREGRSDVADLGDLGQVRCLTQEWSASLQGRKVREWTRHWANSVARNELEGADPCVAGRHWSQGDVDRPGGDLLVGQAGHRPCAYIDAPPSARSNEVRDWPMAGGHDRCHEPRVPWCCRLDRHARGDLRLEVRVDLAV